jgi:hypothetical protein
MLLFKDPAQTRSQKPKNIQNIKYLLPRNITYIVKWNHSYNF